MTHFSLSQLNQEVMEYDDIPLNKIIDTSGNHIKLPNQLNIRAQIKNVMDLENKKVRITEAREALSVELKKEKSETK